MMARLPSAAPYALWILFFSYTANEGMFVNVLNYYTEVFIDSVFP